MAKHGYTKHVYVLVKIDMVGDAFIDEVIEDMNYKFKHEDIKGSEIMGVERVNYSGGRF